jgi:hypothetical protein
LNKLRKQRLSYMEAELWQRLEVETITRPEYLARLMRLGKYRLNLYAQTLAEKRARVRLAEPALWEAYRLGELAPEQMKAHLQAMATQQVKEVGLESYG